MEYQYLILLPLAYLLGSVPFGLLTGKLAKNVDIRQHGSKNIGATNVMRIMGPVAAVLVLLLDVGKGIAAVRFPFAWDAPEEVMLASGFLVVLGHCFSLFLRFKGGKGVATGLGVIISMPGFYPESIILLIIAVLVIALSRIVSLGSMTGAVLFPIFLAVAGYEIAYILTGLAIAVLVIIRHHENIRKLLRGEESRLGQKVKVPEE